MTFDLEAGKASFLDEKSKFRKFRWFAPIPRASRDGRVMPPPSKKLESMISLQGNLDVLPLDRAITRFFVQIDLDVEQLKKRVRVSTQFSSPTPTG